MFPEHPAVCAFCGAPKPDGDGSMCLAYEETYDALVGGHEPSAIWRYQECAIDARTDFEEAQK